MHRSRVGVVLIDHPEDTYPTAAAFWGEAVGAQPSPSPDGRPYASLRSVGDVTLELQRTGVGTAARVHLDIESDDVAAEVERLTGLGARVLQREDDFAMMTDPGGLVFCVVGIQTGEAFERHATTWP